VINSSFVHDSCHNINSWSKNFSIERIDQEFVGDVFDEHNQRHSQYYKIIP